MNRSFQGFCWAGSIGQCHPGKQTKIFISIFSQHYMLIKRGMYDSSKMDHPPIREAQCFQKVIVRESQRLSIFWFCCWIKFVSLARSGWMPLFKCTFLSFGSQEKYYFIWNFMVRMCCKIWLVIRFWGVSWASSCVIYHRRKQVQVGGTEVRSVMFICPYEGSKLNIPAFCLKSNMNSNRIELVLVQQ